MKRGFTLVELLAVIIIIGIIFAITFPLITNNIKISEERAYNLQIEQIIKATKDMIVKDLIEIPNNGESITIYISELKRNGLLPIEMTNPKTKKIISNTSNVVITRTGNSYKYDVNIEDLNYYPLILQKEASNTRKFLDNLLLAKGIRLVPKMEVVSQDLIMEFANIGLGFGFGFVDLAKEKYKNLQEIDLNKELPSTSVYLGVNKDTSLSFASKTFIKYLK